MKMGLELGCLNAIPVSQCANRSQKIFNFFFKIGFSVFQDSGIILSEKNFYELQTNQSPRIAMKLQRQNRVGDSPCSDHMERGLDFGCLIALRCESARRQSRSNIFKVKKIFNFFSKRVFPMFQDSGII